jgi:hypothetical protein
MDDNRKVFKVTYIVEATQEVRSPTLAEAQAYARKYAAEHKGFCVLSIVEEPPTSDAA